MNLLIGMVLMNLAGLAQHKSHLPSDTNITLHLFGLFWIRNPVGIFCSNHLRTDGHSHAHNLHVTHCTCMWHGRLICEQWGEEWRAGMASGVQGSRGATLPVDCELNPCWLLHWCSHCSDLSSLPPRPLKTKEHHPKPDVSPDKSSLQSGPEIFKVNERVMSQWVTFRRSGPTSSSGDDGACQRAGRSECGSNLGTSKNTVCYELADWLIDYCVSCCCSPSSTWAITWADATD